MHSHRQDRYRTKKKERPLVLMKKKVEVDAGFEHFPRKSIEVPSRVDHNLQFGV
jgi:hypothetical protein